MTDGVLFVHAFPLDATMWQEQLRAFGERVPTKAVNLPGFGGTSPAGDVMTMGDAALRCVEELDRVGFDQALVCGLSMGGYVAFELWRRHRERLLGLVLANTRAAPDPEEGKKRRREVAEAVLEQGSEAILESMRTLVSLEASSAVWEFVASIVASQPPEAIAAAALGMAERPDSRPDLAGIDVPTLVVTSTGDRIIPQEGAADMAEGIPNAELSVIDGAGHLSNLERPEEFNRALEGLLRRCALL